MAFPWLAHSRSSRFNTDPAPPVGDAYDVNTVRVSDTKTGNENAYPMIRSWSPSPSTSTPNVGSLDAMYTDELDTVVPAPNVPFPNPKYRLVA